MSSKPRRTAPLPRRTINRRFHRPRYRPPRLPAPSRRVFPRRLDRPAFKPRLPARFNSFLSLGITVGTAAILGAAFLIFESYYSTRVMPHVSVDGIALGGVSLTEAPAYLQARVAERDAQPILLRVGSQSFNVTGRQFKARYDLAPALVLAIREGHDDDTTTRIWNQLVTLIQGREYAVTGTHDPRAVDRYLARLDAAVTVQPRPAVVGLHGTHALILREPVPGHRLDRPAAARLLNRLISTRTDFSATLPLQLTGSPITHDIAQAAVDQAQYVLNRPTLFSIGTKLRGFALQPRELAKLITFTNTFDAHRRNWLVALGIDHRKLKATLAPIAAQVNRPPQPAFFQVALGSNADQDVAVPVPGIKGFVIDTDATAALILSQGPSHTVVVPILHPVSSFDVAAARKLNIDSEWGKAPTLWAGSTAQRASNIQVAADQLNNILLKPGQILSVTGVISPVTTLHGYTVDLNSIARTDISGANGGTVQVASALFQAAYRAGLPILERQQYPFLTALDGQIGYDAMAVARATGPDLQIANDTGRTLLIMAQTFPADHTVTAYVFGNSTVGRKVTVAQPAVTLNQDGSIDATISRQVSGDHAPTQDQIASHYETITAYP